MYGIKQIHLEIAVTPDYELYDGVPQLDRVVLSRAGLPDLDITDYLFQAEFEQAEQNVISAVEKARDSKQDRREALVDYHRELQQEALRESAAQRRIGA